MATNEVSFGEYDPERLKKICMTETPSKEVLYNV
jgi:hypothetical protein